MTDAEFRAAVAVQVDRWRLEAAQEFEPRGVAFIDTAPAVLRVLDIRDTAEASPPRPVTSAR